MILLVGPINFMKSQVTLYSPVAHEHLGYQKILVAIDVYVRRAAGKQLR